MWDVSSVALPVGESSCHETFRRSNLGRGGFEPLEKVAIADAEALTFRLVETLDSAQMDGIGYEVRSMAI